MKRKGNLFLKIISDENLKTAILTVCNSHRWIKYPKIPNKTVQNLENNIDKYVTELKEIIEKGFDPSPAKQKRRYDVNAGKWREIVEPKLFPDQCVHHALIQVLEPIMMRGMDHWCCGSIKGRGAHYGIKGIKKWMKKGKGTKWCIELDIYHFYESLSSEEIMKCMRRLIKDYKTLDLIERITSQGILIGAYCSQWFANTFLQPLDQIIREGGAKHYIRYMDNFTVFTNRKRTADKIIEAVDEWLGKHSLRLKGNWQKFSSKARMPNALGYRYGETYCIMRKKNRHRLIRQLKSYGKLTFIPVKFAQGLLSRLGQLRHCNSFQFYKEYLKPRMQMKLKNVVRRYYERELKAA